MSRTTGSILRGSSPRLRGTPEVEEQEQILDRFIPAPAGNTERVDERRRQSAVHPRACGEHARFTASTETPSGSSPRLRGTPPKHAAAAHPRRFIPAPAGNTSSASPSEIFVAVHPRACGEHLASTGRASLSTGSSPRLRGTPGRPPRRTALRRFIPAPAGNTQPRHRHFRHDTVHPRACGEHASASVIVFVLVGSSPRLRGTRPVRDVPGPDCPVHPRACGEHGNGHGSRSCGCGSSPRLRGTRPGRPAAAFSGRFIPAPAGNT
ncbi:hypothetical protein APM_3478 [Acidiphilium sp. PM]|nr:hypothetical protein APM_3478 [Acidiphilium sp. PM]